MPMRICDKVEKSSDLPATAVALGLFDGVHRGHQSVIRRAVQCSPALTPAVFTFQFDQKSLITKKQFGRILSPDLKTRKLEEMGVEIMLQPAFSTIMSMGPESFFNGILRNFMHAEAVFCGEDFHFGKNAAGNVSLLQRYCSEAHIQFEIVPPLLDGDTPVSSTRIRSALREGDIQRANQLLGYPYITDGVVVHGRHLGHKLGFPTINQLFSTEDLVPHFGVYATIAEIDGQRYIGATDIGVKPTIGEGYAPAAETYLLDFSGDLYGKNVTLSYYAFLRGERKFATLNELTETVLANAAQAKEMLQKFL